MERQDALEDEKRRVYEEEGKRLAEEEEKPESRKCKRVLVR